MQRHTPNVHHLSFPTPIHLTDGTPITVRPMAVSDREQIREFYEAIPPSERLFLQDDPFGPGVLDRLIVDIESGRVLPLLAFHDVRVVAEATLARRLHGWTRHVGMLRTAVHPEYRRRGLASHLLRLLVELAGQIGLDKVVGQVLGDQRAHRRMLEKIGFQKEAVLKDHATDLRGNRHRVIIYSNSVIELWRKMEDLILDSEFEVIP